jgi:hypothetical protein
MRSLVWIALAACSSGTPDHEVTPDAAHAVDAAPAGCSTGTIDGTITTDAVTHTFGPVVRAYVAYDSNQQPALVLDEQPGTCGVLPPAGFNLGFVFAGLPAAGMYTSNTSVLGVAEQDGDANLALSVAGTVTITSADPACITGSYSLSFGSHAMPDEGSLSGTFAVEVCP